MKRQPTLQKFTIAQQSPQKPPGILKNNKISGQEQDGSDGSNSDYSEEISPGRSEKAFSGDEDINELFKRA